MTSPLFDLSDCVAVVSGAARGMGRTIALTFAEAGADLVLADLNAEEAETTAADIRALGRRALPVRCDISNIEQIRALFAQLDQEFGRIDILANVAGEGILCAPEDLTMEQVEKCLHNLVVGRFCCCQEAGRRMLSAGKGSIINIGSLASITALGRGHTAYSMAMGGVAQMTRELSTEWSGRGVRVNTILCAQVVNPGLEERMAADPHLRQTYLRGIPSARLGEPDDIRGPALFLASDASRWVTGALLPMDGGNLAMNSGGTYPGSPALPGF